MRPLVVIGATEGFGRAQPLLARDDRIVVLEDKFSRARETREQPIDVLARPDGTAAALHFAAHSPERINSLVLENPPAAEEFATLLPQLAMPVLVLYGTREGAASERGRSYKALLPNGWFVMVYGAGSDIANDRPEAYADLIGDFLKRGARFTISEQSSRINP